MTTPKKIIHNGRPKPSEEAVEVAKIPPKKHVQNGRPRRVATDKLRSKVAYPSTGNTVGGMGGNFYSPQLSTDFLELPQSIDEKRNFFRHFYTYDPFVGQAVDLHTELPLSKIRLGMPKAKNRDIALKSLDFCTKWAKKVGLLHRLIEIVHDYHLLGEVWVFAEDTSPDMPESVTHETIQELDANGDPTEKKVPYPDADERAEKWLRRNYKGWTALRVMPPEQIHMEAFPFTDEVLVQLIPDSKTKDIVNRAIAGDENAERIVRSMPQDVVGAIVEGGNIPLNTDPDAGSFVYCMARKKSQYEPHGHSILERCLLPGTMVTVERGGVIQEVPVEDVDPSADKLLTHKGRFQPAVKGSRPVDEMVSYIYLDGDDAPLRLTVDHKVLCVRDEKEIWLEAGKLQPGDTMLESHVIPEGTAPTEINLSNWWLGRVITTQPRRSSARTLTVQEVGTDNGLSVTLSYPDDHKSIGKSDKRKQSLVSWLTHLTEPSIASYQEVATQTGLTRAMVTIYANQLRESHGLRTESVLLDGAPRGKRRSTRWYPMGATRAPSPHKTVTYTSPVSTIPLDEEFCYLLGTWLGDGDVWKTTDGLSVASIGWTFGKGDPQLHARVLELATTYLGATTTEHPYGKGTKETNLSVRVTDRLLARWFLDTMGGDCTTKRIPRWVFDLPEGHILSLLRGVLDTDGYVHHDRATSISITLDNPTLIHHLHLLCNRVGIPTRTRWTHKKAHIWTRRWWSKVKNDWVEKTYDYPDKSFPILECTRYDGVWKWAGEGSLKGSKIQWREVKGWKSNFRGTYLTRKIERVDSVPYKGDVYSFDVEQDHSLVTNKVSVKNCLHTLVYRDKLRQSQTSIASRHMTPIRIVMAEGASADQLDEVREQVDYALQDPDYSIIVNFELRWEEMGSQQRLLELSTEYEITDRQLYAGLGVTESLLSGESSYSGDRINLEVINTRYMLLREELQDMVQNKLLEPMCRRMGFIEVDEDGNEEVITPTLSFTRLALRDNSDTFDALFNLYQKGSLDVDVILELLNIDPLTTSEKLKRDVLTLQDSSFNEVLRGLYSEVGRALAENTDVVGKIAGYLGLKYKPKEEEPEGRF